MNDRLHTIKTGIKSKIACAFLLASTVAVSLPAPAHAQATGATCAIGGYLASQISSSIGGALGVAVPVNPAALNAKAFTLDRLASCAAKELLHQMTASTINWINSGFNGSPSFLSDPKGFFLDAADQVTGAFLADSGPLKNLCSPWSVDIRLALALGQSSFNQGQGRYYCTLGRIINSAQNASVSIDGFVAGDFSQGGWPAFVAMTSEPQNNPYGAYLSADSNLLAAIGERQAGLSKTLLEGNGFLSWQNCKDVTVSASNFENGDEAPTGGGDSATVKRCTTETPGSVIAHSLNVHTDSGVVEAELANDINSVVNALVTQLTSQMLSKGLRSLSGGGSGISGSGYTNADSYVSQLRSDASSGQVSGTYTTIVNQITASRANYIDARTCFSNKLAAAMGKGGTASSTAPILSYISTINSSISANVDPLLSSMTAKESAAQNQNSGISNSTAQSDLTYVQGQIQAFNSDANNYQLLCAALP